MGDTAVAEREASLQIIQDKIEKTKSSIQELNSQISLTQTEIIRFQNANKLFKHMQLTALADRPVPNDEDAEPVELNEEHQAIITKKKDQIQPLWNEVEKLEKEQGNSEEILQDLQDECEDLTNEILSLKEKIRSTNSETMKARNQVHFTKKEIQERKREVKLMQDLKTEAEISLSKLSDRGNQFENVDGGRIDCQREILSLQSQLDMTLSQIDEVNSRISEAKEVENELEEEAKAQKAKFSVAVDWQTEQVQLKSELKALTEEIHKRKEEVLLGEKEASRKQEELNKYQALIEKWRGKGRDMDLPEENASELWSQLEIERKAADRKRAAAEMEMAELVIGNARLEEEVKRKRNSLKRMIEQFQTEGNQIKNVIKEKQSASEADENRLLQLIQDAKIKISQRNLKNAKS